MAKTSSLPILEQIRQSGSPEEEIHALRALKNEIIGHEQRKGMWIGLGILEPVVQASTAKANRDGQKTRQERTSDDESLGEEETLRLEALSILGSLAYGGPPFISPLHSASALPAILSNLCPSSNPSLLVLTALQTLSNLTESTSLSLAPHALDILSIADSLFSSPHVISICRILRQSSKASHIQSQKSIAASLITRLCRNERHRSTLANAGVLGALGSNLAEIVVSQGMVIPGVDVGAQKADLLNRFACAAPESADLAKLLESIAVIVADSKLRASQLVYSNSILACFPLFPAIDFIPNLSSKVALAASSAADLSAPQSRLNAIDYLIPDVHASYTKDASALSSAFPPLGTQGSFDSILQFAGSQSSVWPQNKLADDTDLSADRPSQSASDEPESPLIPYLIWLTRSSSGVERLMAAYLLAILYRAGLAAKSREGSIGLLIVPLLVELLGDNAIELSAVADEQRSSKEWLLKERTPAVIAKLIFDSEYLQRAAYEAGIISKLARMIKSSYEPLPANVEARPWSPDGYSSPDNDVLESSQASRLGQKGFSSLLLHRVKVREGVLRAVAALAPFKEEYRKSLIEQGVMPFIVESLKPYPNRPSSKSTEKTENITPMNNSEISSVTSIFGINPVPVLIAACAAVRHLSRSPSILRTTFVDNGVVMPIFNILNHPDVEVQIAATATVCNIVSEISPMRETLSAAGVLKVLCGHAHSANVKMRFNALWALKHLVQGAGNDTKKACLEELGPGWLVQLICENTEEEALYTAPSRSTAPVDHDNDVYMEYSNEDDGDRRILENANATDVTYINSTLSETTPDFQKLRDTSSSTAWLINARFTMLRDVEINPIKRAREDDTGVQEQGLDFIRNLIGCYSSTGIAENSDMIDFLFSTFGQDQIFEILASKLRSKVLNPFARRNSSDRMGKPETRVLPPQPEIIAAVEYILVNVAASIPRHRQQVIEQTELLKLLLAQSNHPVKDVRLAFCWLVINLTWVDDDQDNISRAQRAQELTRLGFLAKLEVLERDSDLDVRDRAKTAVWQLRQNMATTNRQK